MQPLERQSVTDIRQSWFVGLMLRAFLYQQPPAIALVAVFIVLGLPAIGFGLGFIWQYVVGK